MKSVPEGATGRRKLLGFELRSSYRDSSLRSDGDVDRVRCHCNGVESFPKLIWRKGITEGSELRAFSDRESVLDRAFENMAAKVE